MNVYIALLRGINVSGQKIIKMEALKKAFEALHFDRVTTYIQSGNVVFRSPSDAALVRTQIENKLLKAFGYDVVVIVKTIQEIEKAMKRNPFKKIQTDKGERLYVSFLSERPAKAAVQSLTAVKSDVDEIRLIGTEVYILCRNGFGNSLFSNTFLEKKLAVSATTRNWDTVQKLLSLAKEV